MTKCVFDGAINFFSSYGIRHTAFVFLVGNIIADEKMFLCSQKVHSVIGHYIRPPGRLLCNFGKSSAFVMNFLHSIIAWISGSISKMSRMRPEFTGF